MKIKMLAFILLLILNNMAFAEYYVVYYGAETGCSYYACRKPCYHNIYSRAPYRHQPQSSEYEMPAYDWVGDP